MAKKFCSETGISFDDIVGVNNPNEINAHSKKAIYVKCSVLGCSNSARVIPNNVMRIVNQGKKVQILCSDAECQKAKVIKKRAVRPGNSVSEKLPLFSKQLVDQSKCKDIAFTDPDELEIYCLNCNEVFNRSPKSIRRVNNEAWCLYCEKEKCQEQSKRHRSKICKERGSYDKPAKEGKSFADVNQLMATQQHATCNIDLTQKKPQSNDRATFECNNCKEPVSRELSSIVHQDKVFCDGTEACKEFKKQHSRLKDWATRIEKNGSFADNYPYMDEEFVMCVSDPGVKLSDVPNSCTVDMLWQCKGNSDHAWLKDCDARSTNPGCPFCTSNISNQQFRIASELEVLLNVKAMHSVKYDINGQRVEVDIAFEYDGQVYGYEVDGYKWHEDKFSHDEAKNNLLTENEWIIFRIRDSRLKKLGKLKNSKTYYVSSNNYYQQEWRDAIADTVEIITGKRPENYTEFLAEEMYHRYIKFYNDPDKENKQKTINEGDF